MIFKAKKSKLQIQKKSFEKKIEHKQYTNNSSNKHRLNDKNTIQIAIK